MVFRVHGVAVELPAVLFGDGSFWYIYSPVGLAIAGLCVFTCGFIGRLDSTHRETARRCGPVMIAAAPFYGLAFAGSLAFAEAKRQEQANYLALLAIALCATAAGTAYSLLRKVQGGDNNNLDLIRVIGAVSFYALGLVFNTIGSLFGAPLMWLPAGVFLLGVVVFMTSKLIVYMWERLLRR